MGRAQSIEEHEIETRLTGFYSWDVPNNLVFGDANYAAIYGLPPEDAAQGVPVEKILSLIAEEDRGPLARYIHDMLLGRRPETATYTIIDAKGVAKRASSVGSVIRDRDGIPSFYAGAVMCPPSELEVTAGGLRNRIAEAINIAEVEGRDITRGYLSSALRSLGESPK